MDYSVIALNGIITAEVPSLAISSQDVTAEDFVEGLVSGLVVFPATSLLNHHEAKVFHSLHDSLAYHLVVHVVEGAHEDNDTHECCLKLFSFLGDGAVSHVLPGRGAES